MSTVFLIKALQLILSLAILVVLHELGHFIPAKLFKTKVEKFYLFFDWPYSLIKKKIGDTEYGIGILPLGGYVKIAGMIDESMDTEHLNKDPEPWEFRSKPAWQRLIIMLGGVTVNLILGFAIYMMVTFVWGKDIITSENLKDGFEVNEIMKPYGFSDGNKILKVDGEPFENVVDISKYLFLRDVSTVTVQHVNGKIEKLTIPENIGHIMMESGATNPFSPLVAPVIGEVAPNSLAEKFDFKANDRIVTINDIELVKWQELSQFLQDASNEELSFEILRDGSKMQKTVVLDEKSELGVYPKMPEISFTKINYSLFESFSVGYDKAYWILSDYITQFEYVFTPKGITQLGGFGAIGSIFPPSWDWQRFWESTALLSLILAFMNLLPIPALDGGHVMFLLYEVFSGRKPNDKFMEYAQMTGFLLLVSLVLFANGNDVYRYFFS
ncbi:RIP metalloprotease RseP [Flavobacteriaceae bacterium]|nr:RIP metalloprotease RseP [Flavobacteriaceae bacterium]